MNYNLLLKEILLLFLTYFLALILLLVFTPSTANVEKDRFAVLIVPLKEEKSFKLAVTIIYLNDDFINKLSTALPMKQNDQK